jgi:hypothetical protein
MVEGEKTLRTFEFTDEEIRHMAGLIAAITTCELVAPIEAAIWLRREVREVYTKLSVTERQAFRGRLNAKLLYRAYLMTQQGTGKPHVELPEVLVT